MLWGLIVFGGFWFWTVAAIVVIAIIIALEGDRYGEPASATALMGAVLLIGFSADFNPFTWVATNWAIVLLGIAAYLGLGVLYGIVKWYLYCRSLADRYEDIRRDVLRRYEIAWNAPLPDGVRVELKSLARDKLGVNFPPEAHSNKKRIISWMSFWPFSALWTLLNDPVRRFYRFAYARIVGIMQRIGDHVFRNIRSEL